jgi:transposase
MISRTGNTSLQAALFIPSLIARRHNPLLKQFAERLLPTGMSKKTVIRSVMHKMIHLTHGVIRTGKPFDVNHLSKGLALQDGICPAPRVIRAPVE